MTTDGGRRIATAGGAMLVGPASLGSLPESGLESWFDPGYWRDRGELLAAARGRGSAWFVTSEAHPWVLRHYRRGGFVARLLADRYAWAGEARVRSFAEWRLLRMLWQQGLSVPQPIAARYQRAGFTYRCDLITRAIPQAEPLSAALAAKALESAVWRDMGNTVARLHRLGVDHADLNAHNILVGAAGSISVIDFDRGRIRTPGAWRGRNLRRLQRSIRKITFALPSDRFSPADWKCFMAGYEAA